ncbi:MAG: M23 family metallopeptidase [Bacteroidales bacterium]|nr:M23 family metallopeptidase [Bacteroidales bacterium]
MKNKKHTYKFNPHTLSYEKVRVTVHERVKKISFTVAFGLVLGVVFLIVGFQIVDSPKEKNLKREIAQYKRQIKSLNERVDRAELVLKDLEERDDNIYRTIFDAEPVPNEVRNSGIGGVERYADLEGYDCSESIIATSRKVDDLSKRLYVESHSLDEIYEMARTKNERMTSMPAIMPVAKNKCKIVSGFGVRYHPILKSRRAHTGIDMTAQKGTPIYATGNGVVIAAGRNVQGLSGYGIVCVINHGYGFQTLYAHMSDVKVRVGQKVKRGELIGHVGSTGLSQGSHLHYEVILNGKKVDPVYYFFNDLTPSEYEEVIEAAKQDNQCLS